MNESISRAAGAVTGQEMTPEVMRDIVRASSSPQDPRSAYQRTTLYERAGASRVAASIGAAPVGATLPPVPRHEGLDATGEATGL